MSLFTGVSTVLCATAGAVLLALLPASSATAANDPPRFDLPDCEAGEAELSNCLHHVEIAKNFWTYAVMAADTYRKIDRFTWKRMMEESLSRGAPPATETADADNSAQFPKEPSAAPDDKSCEYQNDTAENWNCDAEDRYGDRVYQPKKVRNMVYTDCSPTAYYAPSSATTEPEIEGWEPPQPSAPFRWTQAVAVPLEIEGWKRLFDFDKSFAPRGFWVFVPGLFLEVWTREDTEKTRPQAEYAIVFRGTQGNGGWWSNLRFITSIIPFFDDQYAQARRTFPRLVDQIQLREKMLARKNGGRGPARITLVGHSLGGALAYHTAIRHSGVHRLIVFNPSPVTGYFSEAPDARARHLRTLERVDVIVENAEILHFINTCEDGTRLAPEVEAKTYCHVVNLTGGDPLTQHEMGPMACRLTVAAASWAAGRISQCAGRNSPFSACEQAAEAASAKP